jgi:aryl-alcohol dehydrogenase-like predicted oxidoreductase
MASGLLTGRFTGERAAALPDDDWRRTAPAFQQPALGRSLELVERLRKIAAAAGCSLPELAVAWTLHCDGVDGAIVGARSIEQLEGWIGAAALRLEEGVLESVAAAVTETGAGSGPMRARAPRV